MSLSRLTLPENFYDKTSDKLLCQPQPQFVFAALFLAAIGAALPMPASIGLDGREVPSAGGAYAAPERDRLELAEKLPTSLFAVGIDFNASTGSAVRINRPSFPSATPTQATRKIATGQTISTTPRPIGSEQTHLILERYAGPANEANTGVAPLAIESFDANMGVHSAPSIVGTHLVNDFHRFLDAVHVTLGDSGATIYPDGMSADNDATTAGSFPMTLEQVSRCEEEMDDANLPTLPDGSRVLMLSPKQWKQLKHDPEYKAQAEFHKEFNLLFPNYVGSVGKFHIFKSTTLSRPTNGSSVPVHRGIAMAPGCYMGGMGRKPRAASSTDDNYGETGKVVWIGDLAFGIADSRFFRSLRSA
jgi:hypothetical protein